jgi:uncharacterized protein (DUF1501 family)
MQAPNLITRRRFLSRSGKIGLGVALSTLVDMPLVLKRALAEGSIGQPGPGGEVKKILFIFLRGACDALNTVIPVRDPAYSTVHRPSLYIPEDGPSTIYDETTGICDFPVSSGNSGDPNFATYHYGNSITLRNGFAALHPSLKFLAPLYNSGELALMHRVGYPNQSRSHFDSQRYWENGIPNNNGAQEGIFYRAMVESGLAGDSPLTGVSIQSSLPLLLRGSGAAMTNLSDPTRYELLGIPRTSNGDAKAQAAFNASLVYPLPHKASRDLLNLQQQNLTRTLKIFEDIDFSENGNNFVDDIATDGGADPYHLFPTQQQKNGGYAVHAQNPDKYVVPSNSRSYNFFKNLKAAALLLNRTDAVIAGTELTGWDTHNNQGALTGTHPELLQRVGWAIYGLKKYFTQYGRGNNAPSDNAKVNWNDVLVITLSEFGRTTIENANLGTDHAEGGTMFVAGGSVNGGLRGCHPSDSYNGNNVPWVTGDTGTMFGVRDRYLERSIDYRSVLGELIRDHLGATQDQLNRIIPGYSNPAENLIGGGTGLDGTSIAGELGLV